MTDRDQSIPEPKPVGKWLCLEFTNTLGWRFREKPDEKLSTYHALVTWGQRTGILTSEQKRWLSVEADQRPEAAALVLERAIGLRDAIFRIFAAITDDAKPNGNDVAVLDEAVSNALSKLRLAMTADAFVWHWPFEKDGLEQILWPIARSAAQLLTSDALNRVGMCQGDGCGWLFFDTSKNQSRRWCSMEDCGNRAKARRHYRQRAKGKTLRSKS